MQTRPIRSQDIRYNAATQSFEALVTVRKGDVSRSYACAIAAPITMSFAEAAEGLRIQAMRRMTGRGGLHSTLKRLTPAQRAGRRSFDPIRWLEKLMDRPGRDAA